MENLKDGPSQASDTLFARALKQQWPAMEAAIVARMSLAGQDVDGPPFRRELVAATKYLLEADQFALEQDVPGNPRPGTASKTAISELLQHPDYLEFLRSRACTEDSRTVLHQSDLAGEPAADDEPIEPGQPLGEPSDASLTNRASP